MSKVQSKNAFLYDLNGDAGELKIALREAMELGSAADEDASAFATAGQGAKADSAIQPDDIVTTVTDGLMAVADKLKLNGIATGATANATDAALRDRSTHTGEQAMSTVTGLIAALGGKATPADISAAISALVNSSPGALDTLNELATALGNDPNFATTMTTALGNRLRVDTAAQGLSAGMKANGRANLDLRGAALLDVGTSSGTVAAGDDSRIVGALQPLTNIKTRTQVVRGNGIVDALWDANVGSYQNGERGALFIWNDPTQTFLDGVTGYNSGMQIWIGNNPTPTPGAGHAVASTICVVNGNGRNALYGQNILVGASNSGSGYVDAFVCGMEINVYADYASTVSDAFLGGNRKNGLELTSQGSTGRVTAAAMVWSADATGAAWWQEGIAISRSVNNGLRFTKDPGGQIDGISAFQNAAILDESGSTNVLKVSNSHTAAIKLDNAAVVDRVIDLESNPTLNYFVKGKSTENTMLRMANSADYSMVVSIGSGNAAGQNATLAFADRATTKWSVIKTPANALAFYGSTTGTSAIQLIEDATNPVKIRAGGIERVVEIGEANSGGTGFYMLRVAH
ncbi:hypothetical protein ACQZ4R_13025 [Agrobacterium vitis]